MHREILSASLLLLSLADFAFIVDVLATFERRADEIVDYTPLQLWQLVEALSRKHGVSTGVMDAIRLGQGYECEDVITRRAA